MKRLKFFIGILAVSSMSLLFTACPGGPDEPEPAPTPTPEPTPIENTGGGDVVNIEKIISENVSVSAEYKYYTFVVDLYTYLTDEGKYFAGRNDIKYGIEWFYTYRPGQHYYYHIDPKNNFMWTTKVSSNHYNIVVPIFTWDDDEEKMVKLNFFSFQYYSLKMKEQNETLSKDEIEALRYDEKLLSPYISEAGAYRGKVFVEIGGKIYYVCSFQK